MYQRKENSFQAVATTDKQFYNNANKRAKRAVAASKQASWAELADSLRRRDGQEKMYKLAKQARKERKDLIVCKFVRGDDNCVKIEDVEMRETWKGYYTSLLNQEYANIIEDTSPVLGPIQEVTEQEVRAALRGMKPGKAAGPSGVTADLLKVVEDAVINKLKIIFNGIVYAPKSGLKVSHSPYIKGREIHLVVEIIGDSGSWSTE